jgi:hypothetical protein
VSWFLASNGATCTSLTTSALFWSGKPYEQFLRYNSATTEQTEVASTHECELNSEPLAKSSSASVQLPSPRSSRSCELLECKNTSTEVSTEVQIRSVLYSTQAPPLELETYSILVWLTTCVVFNLENISMLVLSIASLNAAPTL